MNNVIFSFFHAKEDLWSQNTDLRENSSSPILANQRTNLWQRDSRVRSQIQVLLQGLFLKTSHCFQRRITPNVLPTWCHFLSDSDDACAPTLLGGSRVITQTLRMSMKIQFRGVWGRIRGSNHNRPFYNFDF